jgi:hypothetical protein
MDAGLMEQADVTDARDQQEVEWQSARAAEVKNAPICDEWARVVRSCRRRGASCQLKTADRVRECTEDNDGWMWFSVEEVKRSKRGLRVQEVGFVGGCCVCQARRTIRVLRVWFGLVGYWKKVGGRREREGKRSDGKRAENQQGASWALVLLTLDWVLPPWWAVWARLYAQPRLRRRRLISG